MASLPTHSLTTSLRTQCSKFQDCLFIVLVFILSAVNYIAALGFCAEDWALLAIPSLSPDQSFFGVFTASIETHDHEIRPIQFLEIVLPYKLFGLIPFGYHCLNALVLCLGYIGLYLVARTLDQPRVLALSVAVVFMLVPNYSTDRFWIASAAASLSMCFFFFALWAHLQALRFGPNSFRLWEPFAVLGVAGSGFSYEVFLPLFLVASALLFVSELAGTWPRSASASTIRRAGLRQAPIAGAVVIILVVKALWAPRVPHDLAPIGYLLWVGRATLKALIINYGYHLLLLPVTVLHIIRDYADPVTIITAASVGAAIWIRLYTLCASLAARPAASRATTRIYLWVGIGLFLAGYSLFPINPAENGPNNRAAIAGTLGFALSVVGLVGMLARFAAGRWRNLLFSSIIASIGMSGALIIGVISSFWITSYRQQIEILADIRRQIPEMPSGATLILDGICPYHGVAPVFEAAWDLSGALSILYRTADIHADIAGRGVSIEQYGLVIPPTGDQVIYPYGMLYVYHFGRKEVYVLPDAHAARRYFESTRPARSSECPADEYGNGMNVLNSLMAKLRHAAVHGIGHDK